MLKRFVRSYYKLLDEKIENWTIMVLIIAVLITSVWNVTNDSSKSNLLVKANILETKTTSEIIIINGKTYQLVD